MPGVKSVTFHRRAAMAVEAPSQREKLGVKNVVRAIEGPAGGTYLQSRTAKMPTSEPMYLMRATPDIRFIYHKTSNGIEIPNVVKRATLTTFLNNRFKEPGSQTPVEPATPRGARKGVVLVSGNGPAKRGPAASGGKREVGIKAAGRVAAAKAPKKAQTFDKKLSGQS